MAFLALNVAFRKFSFSWVKIHLNTHSIQLGQNVLGPPCHIEYGCANFWCQKPTTVERMYALIALLVISVPSVSWEPVK